MMVKKKFKKSTPFEDIERELIPIARRAGTNPELLFNKAQKWRRQHSRSELEHITTEIINQREKKRELSEELNRLTRIHSNLTGRRSVLRFSCGEQIRYCEALSLTLIGLTSEHKRLCEILQKKDSLQGRDQEMIQRYVTFENSQKKK